VRISATTLESFRLFMAPSNDWMTEEELLATIRGEFVPNHKVKLGLAFGKVLETPERYRGRAGYQCGDFFFSNDVMAPALAEIDRRGIFEVKSQRLYGDCMVVCKADHLLGSHLSEFKTTLSNFNADKYAESCQWRFMADILQPALITYRVFCLSEDHQTGEIGLNSIETMNLYPYPALHQDCCDLVEEFKAYVTRNGLDGILRERQKQAEAA
jgi:hypothetical protein